MGILECASGASVWGGYEYYEEKKVVSLEEIEENIFSAKVSGNSSAPYSVELHVDHPRKSKCSCPHAEGKRIVCKHIVAAYFTAFPKEAKTFYAEAMAYQEEEERRQAELPNKVYRCVQHMKKNELQEELLRLLFEGPGWQLERFVRENGLDD